MMPSDTNQAEDVPEGTETGFEQAISGPGDFGESQLAGFEGSEPELPQGGTEPGGSSGDFGENSAMIMGLPVMMKVVLGSAKMPVATLAKLAKGSVVKLDILVNGRLIARGEVVVLNEGTSRFGVVLTQVGSPAGAAK